MTARDESVASGTGTCQRTCATCRTADRSPSLAYLPGPIPWPLSGRGINGARGSQQRRGSTLCLFLCTFQTLQVTGLRQCSSAMVERLRLCVLHCCPAFANRQEAAARGFFAALLLPPGMQCQRGCYCKRRRVVSPSDRVGSSHSCRAAVQRPRPALAA